MHYHKFLPWLIAGLSIAALGRADNFEIKSDRFADIQVLRYEVPGFENLTLQQKKLAYYLFQAGLSGRDIYWDQRYGHNLEVRKTLEAILNTYKGERAGADWDAFLVYAKRVFFSSGIHHHYASSKMLPGFPAPYLATLIVQSDAAKLPLEGRSVADFTQALTPILFDPKLDARTVNLDPGIDNIVASANHYYRGVNAAEVEAFYAKMVKSAPNPRVMFGLNSQLAKEDGQLVERTWKVGGMYGPAIEKIVFWLEKASAVAENDAQKRSIEELIRFYRTGNIDDFDRYSIGWVTDTQSMIDNVNGFIETYGDAADKRGAYEAVVSMRDDEATRRIAAISGQAQWFEDHSPIMDAHKKSSVTGISARVITAIGMFADASSQTPIGFNLPNAEWIREKYGSKSVTLANLIKSNNELIARSPQFEEFVYDPAALARLKKWYPLSNDLHVDMHEVIGHASGRINPGVASMDQTLKNYSSALEEARADLVALYYVLDPKLVEIGVMPSLDVGRAGYDRYILNGLMMQLNRIKPGDNLQEAHMRNRQMIAAWVFEKGQPEKVIERITNQGKTYFRINDYEKLRGLFGQLLREVQRVKSEGDFKAGKDLIENYGVKVDQALLTEVHRRYEPLNLAPYTGFIQPRLVPVEKDGEIVDVKVEIPTDFLGQMLEYGRDYSFLPIHN
jgi:dipeptidyl-peptidase III